VQHRIEMSAGSAGSVRLARGVRFRRLPDGAGVLLVPEGVVNLSQSAAAIAELIDGERSSSDIAAALTQTFDAPRATIEADVDEMLARFAGNTWLDDGSRS
jgi:pyrroloquinoline quinone biosynthesis protein D